MNDQELLEELNRLFHTAKKFEEAEFIQVLIGFNGIGDQRAITHLYESREFIKDIKSLIEGSQNKHCKTRLLLLLYCHIFEMDELYNIIGNLLRISIGQGNRYIPDLYNKHNEENLTPTEKFSLLESLANQSRFEELINGIKRLYNNKIRNSFFHSSYSLIEDDFCIVKGEGIRVGNTFHNIISIDNFLIPLILSSINFIERFFQLIDESKLQYKSNKLIQARFSTLQNIMVLGDPIKGLFGFQSVKGRWWVKITNKYGTENFIEAMNLSNYTAPKDISELSDRLATYDNKNLPIGKEFEKLKVEILQSNNLQLKRSLAITYYNWANNTAKEAAQKTGREKEILFRYSLQRYDLSIQSDETFGRAYHNKATTKLKLALFKNNLDNNERLAAIEEIKKTLQYEPLMYEAHLNLGNLLFEISIDEKDFNKKISLLKEGIDSFNKAIDIYPKAYSDYQYRARLYWELAQKDIESGEKYFSFAVQDYKKAISLNPKLDFYLSLSTLFGDYASLNTVQSKYYYELSVQTLEEAQKIYGENSLIEYFRGNKYMMLAHLTDEEKYLKLASHSFEYAINLDNKNTKALNNLANCQIHFAIKNKDNTSSIKILEDAIKKLNEVIEIDPNNASAYYNLGIIYIEVWRRTEAVDKVGLLEKSIINLAHGESLKEGLCTYDLARVFALFENSEKAIFWLDKFLKNNEVEKESLTKESDFETLFNLPQFEELLQDLCKN